MFSKLWLSRRATSATVDIRQSAKHANPLQTVTHSSTRIFGDSEPKNEHVPEHTASSTSSPQRTFNIVLFGETADEKSSVINLTAREEIAAVSSASCSTMQYDRYNISFDDVNFAIYDTAGLKRPQISANEYLKAVEQAYKLIDKLGAAGGIHLLLFCLPAGRITATVQSNYRLFHEYLCNGEVPTALVFTGLEMEVEMEDWWGRNKKDIESYGIKSDNHACVTVVQDDEDDHKFLASQVKMRQLLKECTIKHYPFSPETHFWFAEFTRGMKGFINKKVPKKKQIMKVLTQRCRLDQETARRVTTMIENGNAETNKGKHGSEDNEPRKDIGPEKNPTILRSSSSERADLPAGILSNESIASKRGQEDLRGINGDDEPEDGRKLVPGEPSTKDNSPPKEHEDPHAGDGEELVKKSIDDSMSNGHDQKGQQAGIRGGTETRKISTNGDSLLNEHRREEDWLSWKRRGSGERMMEAATQSAKDNSSSDEHEKKVVQRTGPKQGDGREKTETAMVSLSFLPKVHYKSEHSPAGEDESGSRDGREIKVVKDSKMDRASLDKNEELQATKVRNGGTRVSKVILTSNDPLWAWKDLSSDEESDRHSVLAVDESMLNGREQKDQPGVISGGGKTETGKISTNGDPLLAEHLKKEGSKTGAPTNQFRNELSPAIDLTGQVTKSDHHPFASGGCGDIYRGIYHSDEGPIDVAIKTTRMYLQHGQPEQLRKNIKRFRRETAVWWGLKHPNVLPFLGTIMDPKTNPDIPAMVCPLVKNGTLMTYLVEKNNLTLAKRLLLIDNVAHGLQYLHSQKIVHGDLSGSNVLIDDEGMAYIADFGLSTLLTRLGGTTFATSHHAKGTLRWIAPELCDINDHDIVPTTQGDVYSFGCIMLQILTSKVPYHYFSNDAQVICAIMTGRKPERPDGDVIDDSTWKFIEWCWSPATAAEPCPRPSSDRIVAFTEMELGKLSKC